MLRFTRHYTTDAAPVYEQVRWKRAASKITEPDGTVVFEMNDVEVPDGWSQVAVDVLAQKYLRKAGVPDKTRATDSYLQFTGPSWLVPSVPAQGAVFGGETSAAQVFLRMAGCWTYWGWRGGYFRDEVDARVFYDEIYVMLARQVAAPNSPQWFNTGLSWAYGIAGEGGQWVVEADTLGNVKPVETPDAYARPQVHACFINRVEDNLVGEAGIYDLLAREARIFKYGSGAGSNFSMLRGKNERLSGGGVASGLISFLEVLDRGAGAIQSGGTCLAPDQHVYTTRGPVKVSELAAANEDFVCLSYDPPAGRFKAKTARAWLAGTKPVVRVVTDKGEFRLSNDHPVLLNGELVVNAGELREGQSIFACSVDGKYRPRVSLRDGAKGKELLHRMVATDVLGWDLSGGRVVHHRDGNREDSSPKNLELLPNQSVHAALHNAETVATGEHIFQRQKFNRAGTANGMHASSQFWNDPIKVETYRQQQRDNLSVDRASRMQAASMPVKMLNTVARVKNLGGDVSSAETYLLERERLIGKMPSRNGVRRALKRWFPRGWNDVLRQLSASNHRVVSVEVIGEMSVYDVEVDCPTPDDKTPSSGHNFVIWPDGSPRGRGIVVFNTRRAAKMVVVDADHPEIEDFIAWKPREEAKAAAMAVGSRVLAARAPGTPQAMLDRAAVGMEPAVYDLGWECEPVRTVSGQNANNTVRLTDAFMRRAAEGTAWDLKARTTGEVTKTVNAADLWQQLCRAAWACADPGLHFADTINAWHTCPEDGEILSSNPCCFPAGTYVKTSMGFMDIAELEQRGARDEVLPHAYGYNRETGDFAWGKITRAWVAGETSNLVEVRTQGGQVIRCTPEHRWLVKDGDYVEAAKLSQGTELLSTLTGYDRVVVVRSVATVAPATVYDLEVEGCHNFGVRMDDTPGGDSLIVSNSEYFFLDETACNLASLRLTAFQDVNMPDDDGVNLEAFEHAARLWTIVLDISVSMASYPAAEIARGSYNYRTLGLGYCDLGGLLARLDLRYDSDHGRALAAGLTALMTGVAYRTSAELTAAVGPFPRYEANAPDMHRVIWNHARAVSPKLVPVYEGLNVTPPPESDFNADDLVSEELRRRTKNAWSTVLGVKAFRNAQVSLLAPTGTISLVMTPTGHQVTSGVEPYFSPLTVKSLAGGGEMNFAANVRDEDCAVSARPLSAAAHVRMVAAVQPYLSGAVSKTINLPNHATVADVADVYALAHRLGLKAVALYRDGSKLNQPLTTGAAATSAVAQPESIDLTDIPEASVEFFEKARLILPSDRSGGAPLPRGAREYLPWRRNLGFRQKVKIDGQTIFTSFSEYPDGRPGEMFLDLAHEGSTLRGMANCLAMAVSLGLQSGVPAAKFAELFRGARFEPAGVVEGHDRIKMASSIPDYLGRELAITYCGDDDAGQVVPAVAVDTGQAVVALDQRAVRLAAGRYTGDICPACHNATMEPAGKCLRCVTCGETSGCG